MAVVALFRFLPVTCMFTRIFHLFLIGMTAGCPLMCQAAPALASGGQDAAATQSCCPACQQQVTHGALPDGPRPSGDRSPSGQCQCLCGGAVTVTADELPRAEVERFVSALYTLPGMAVAAITPEPGRSYPPPGAARPPSGREIRCLFCTFLC